ncbi:MAG: DUF1127 domain-containing protein [Pseudorhodobacter sp.]
MAAYETSRPAPFGASHTHRFLSIFGGAFERLAKWNDTRVTRNALSKLSDRELDDIGLCRGDINRIGQTAAF